MLFDFYLSLNILNMFSLFRIFQWNIFYTVTAICNCLKLWMIFIASCYISNFTIWIFCLRLSTRQIYIYYRTRSITGGLLLGCRISSITPSTLLFPTSSSIRPWLPLGWDNFHSLIVLQKNSINRLLYTLSNIIHTLHIYLYICVLLSPFS